MFFCQCGVISSEAKNNFPIQEVSALEDEGEIAEMFTKLTESMHSQFKNSDMLMQFQPGMNNSAHTNLIGGKSGQGVGENAAGGLSYSKIYHPGMNAADDNGGSFLSCCWQV